VRIFLDDGATCGAASGCSVTDGRPDRSIIVLFGLCIRCFQPFIYTLHSIKESTILSKLMISLTTPAMGCLFRSVFHLTKTYDSYSYELEELTSAMMNTRSDFNLYWATPSVSHI
jgi:hypothetical protein